MVESHNKQVFIIGGPNGAGKTTSAFSLMPELIQCEEYINADAIAASLSPFKPESIAVKAGRLMLERIHVMAEKGENFAFETTMASKSFVKLLTQCKKAGYQISLLYLWLVNPNLAVQRVKSRVEKGGHAIPKDVVIRRYHRSMSNLINLYIPLADRWVVFDNSIVEPLRISEKLLRHRNMVVYNQFIWEKFEELKL